MIEVSHIARTYTRGDGTPVPALRDVSFTIGPGEFVTVRGASGSGKSSLLNILGCLDTPTSGHYRLDGEDVSQYNDQQRSRIRNRKIGFVFQSFNLLPRTTAVENVEIPALYSSGRVDRERALAILGRVGLAERAAHFVTELSGGEQQRVGIARALANDPAVLLMDEPMGALDAFTREQVQEILLRAWAASNKMVFFITHSVEEALFLATRLIVMSPSPGRISHTYDNLPFSREFLGHGDARRVKSQPEFIRLREEVLGHIHHREPAHG